MAFEETQFPSDVDYSSGGGPMYRTDITELNSGHEQRNKVWTNPRHTFTIQSAKQAADVDAIVDFFHAMQGRFHGFRFKDWSDYQSVGMSPSNTTSPTDQVIGTGDGTTAIFQIVKNYTQGSQTYARDIKKPIGATVSVAVGGIEKSTPADWSLDTTTGLITFVSAPATTTSVTAGYQFDVPVRFDTDELDLEHLYFNYGAMNIRLIELRL